MPGRDANSEWIQRDKQSCWHPFTQAQTALPPIPVVRGEGEFLIAADGTRYFDAVSSWWVNLHGHCNPVIANAIAQQAQVLEHTMFAGQTHPPAIELAERLIDTAPAGFSKVFYADNGSTAIEVALKMVFQYWSNLNQPERRTLIALQGGYHGDTFGAMATGRSSGFYDPFEPWLFDVEFIPTGLCEASEQAALTALDALIAQQGTKLAGLILEPLVQGAAGMRMMRAEWCSKLIQRAQQAGLLVILDEVFTGFGRTGTTHAAHQLADFGAKADLLCLSKGLTGGFMPMGATLATERVFDAFLSPEVGKALLHGHSYTANPLGCAAALASLDLLLQADTQHAIAQIEAIHRKHLPRLLAHPAVQNPRVLGTLAAFELKSGENRYGSQVSSWLRAEFAKEGILVRPLANTLYWVPPYCTSTDTLHNAYASLFNVLEHWQQGLGDPNGSELF